MLGFSAPPALLSWRTPSTSFVAGEEGSEQASRRGAGGGLRLHLVLLISLIPEWCDVHLFLRIACVHGYLLVSGNESWRHAVLQDGGSSWLASSSNLPLPLLFPIHKS